jgi:hypothetical protein
MPMTAAGVSQIYDITLGDGASHSPNSNNISRECSLTLAGKELGHKGAMELWNVL